MNRQVLDLTAGATSPGERPFRYAMMTLHELAQRIAALGDSAALTELHQRTPFRLNGSGPICLAGFIDLLRREAMERGADQADGAYDLTVDKFSRLGAAGQGSENPDLVSSNAVDHGTDCRRYFDAFVKHLDENQEGLGGMTALDREMFEVKALQGLVCRHFKLSLQECQRAAFMNRYVWRLPEGSLTVLMPRSISGRARRKWLEENVADPDPHRPNEQARVQEIIDAHIGQPRPFSLPGHKTGQVDRPWMQPIPIPGSDPVSISIDGLANTIAREKAATIHQQRPAIRALGPEKLQAMIRRIFDGLADEQYCLVQVAEQYGLSKATLSRFAGIRWGSGSDPLASPVPDLWRNTAKVIGNDPDLVEAARHAGVWQQIELVTQDQPAPASPGKVNS